jgi:hypothetical protein
MLGGAWTPERQRDWLLEPAVATKMGAVDITILAQAQHMCTCRWTPA